MAVTQQEGDGRATMPPYYAFSTFKTFLRHMKPHKLPSRIDRSLLGSFAGGDQSRILTSLRFLGLIDDKGEPTERLGELLAAYETDQWPSAVENLLRANYAPLFQVDLASASPGLFNERFRNAYQGADDVVRKSMTFFLNAAREANIEISPHITKNKKPRALGTAARRRSPRRSAPEAPTSTPAPEPLVVKPPAADTGNGAVPKAPNAYELLAVFDPSDMNADEQAAVWTLIQYLKRKEVVARSSEQRRQKPAKAAAAAATAPEAKEATMEPP